jgi:hypothetical protein
MILSRFVAIILCALAILSVIPAHAAIVPIRVVARSNTIAPGTSLSFGSFRYPVLSDNGALGFQATLPQASASTNEGYWAEFNGTLTMIAREGSATPIGGTYVFSPANYVNSAPSLYSTGALFQTVSPKHVVVGNARRIPIAQRCIRRQLRSELIGCGGSLYGPGQRHHGRKSRKFHAAPGDDLWDHVHVSVINQSGPRRLCC